jgi:hypothetical protein
VLNVQYDNDEDFDDFSHISHPTKFYLIFNTTEPLNLNDSIDILNSYNKNINEDDGKTIGILCGNSPLFLKVIANSLDFYEGNVSQFIKGSEDYMEKLSQKNFKKFKMLVQTFMIEFGIKILPKNVQRDLLNMSVFTNTFDFISFCIITKVTSERLCNSLNTLLKMGIIEFSHLSMRYQLHDIARNEYCSYSQKIKDSVCPEVFDDSVKYYYSRLKNYNLENEFSGIKFIIGLSRYDLDYENMQMIKTQMSDSENKEEEIEFLNNSRYILRDLVYAEKRGILYHKLKSEVEKLENNLEKSYYYEGFGLVFLDLTVNKFDYNNRIIQQHMKIYH